MPFQSLSCIFFRNMTEVWPPPKRLKYAKALMKICEQCLEPFWTDTGLGNHIRDEHHKTTCWGCDQLLTFNNIPFHGRCCKIDLECTSCGEVGRGKEILKHLDTHKEAISCPLGCGERFFSGRLYRRRVGN